MSARREPVFYSFYFDEDVMRVQLIRNIGMIEDNAPVSKNDWESIRRRGDAAIQKWIDDNMAYTRCVIVLVGTNTYTRPWVNYEIRKAWRESKGLFGIYIHNLKSLGAGTSAQGRNPFAEIPTRNGQPLSTWLTCYDPGYNAYGTIAANMQSWVTTAIHQAKTRFG